VNIVTVDLFLNVLFRKQYPLQTFTVVKCFIIVKHAEMFLPNCSLQLSDACQIITIFLLFLVHIFMSTAGGYRKLIVAVPAVGANSSEELGSFTTPEISIPVSIYLAFVRLWS